MTELRHCAISDFHLEPESVDLVLTDPPYPREYLDTWRELGVFAGRVLRPGGWLVAMSSHIYLPTVVGHLEASGLDYRWTIACMTPGSNTRIWPRHVYAGWKPVFCYAKGEVVPERWIEDRVVSRPDKRFHEWGQSLNVFESLALSFSSYGELVCDPFLGGGTTAAAAILNGRRFIGADVDEGCIRKTETRILAVEEFLRRQRALIT